LEQKLVTSKFTSLHITGNFDCFYLICWSPVS